MRSSIRMTRGLSKRTNVFAFSIGVGPHVHDDVLTAFQLVQPANALTQELHLSYKPVWRLAFGCITEICDPDRYLYGLFGVDHLMDPACTQVGCGRNLPDGQPTFVGGFDRPHSFDMSIGQTKICGSQPFNKSLLVLEALSEGFFCLHAPWYGKRPQNWTA